MTAPTVVTLLTISLFGFAVYPVLQAGPPRKSPTMKAQTPVMKSAPPEAPKLVMADQAEAPKNVTR